MQCKYQLNNSNIINLMIEHRRKNRFFTNIKEKAIIFSNQRIYWIIVPIADKYRFSLLANSLNIFTPSSHIICNNIVDNSHQYSIEVTYIIDTLMLNREYISSGNANFSHICNLWNFCVLIRVYNRNEVSTHFQSAETSLYLKIYLAKHNVLQ